MVELNNQFEDAEAGTADLKVRPRPAAKRSPNSPAWCNRLRPFRATVSLAGAKRRAPFRPAQEQPAPEGPRATEPPADGVKRVADVLNAATAARWPMYCATSSSCCARQMARSTNDATVSRASSRLVRACQKDGLVRLERDHAACACFRVGAAARGRSSPAREVPAEGANGNVQVEAERPHRPVERPAWEAEAAAAAESHEAGDADAEVVDNEPMPTSDPTAELLGTGSRRKRVSRVPASAPAPARRTAKTAARKPAAAAPRRSRAKKSSAEPAR